MTLKMRWSWARSKSGEAAERKSERKRMGDREKR